ncbi:MAG: prohibitin family protein [Dehalococcoidia bacterium]|nr:prohibitin family protein [Dehalococcoidia bacterium]
MSNFLHLALFLIGVIIAGALILKSGKNGPEIRQEMIIPGVLIFLLLSALGFTFGQVTSGEVGVVTSFGRVTGDIKTPGAYLLMPFVNTVELMDVQTHAYEAEASAASQDLQIVQTKVTVNYQVSPAQAAQVFTNLRRDYGPRVIVPSVQETVKAVTAKFNAEQLVTERQTVKDQIEATLKQKLQPYGIVSENVSITDFQFSKDFSAAIESKVAAAQSALQAENKLRQVHVEAQQAKAHAEGQRDAAIAMAEGSKRAAILNAEGQAEATLTLAKAQSDANRLLTASVTDTLIRYNMINKLAADLKVIVLPPGSNFLLSDQLLGTAPK